MIRVLLVSWILDRCLDALFDRIEGNLLSVGVGLFGSSGKLEMRGEIQSYSDLVVDLSDRINFYLPYRLLSAVTVMDMVVVYRSGVLVRRVDDEHFRVDNCGGMVYGIRLVDEGDFDIAVDYYRGTAMYHASDDHLLWVFFHDYFPYNREYRMDRVLEWKPS